MSYEERLAEQQYNEKVKAAEDLLYYAKSSTDDKKFQALELLDQAIALKPNNSSAYYTKAYNIAQIKDASRVGYIPVTVSNDNLKSSFDNFLKCADLERYEKWAYDNFTYVFLSRKLDNSHGEPGKTNLPFDDAQIEALSTVFGKIVKGDQDIPGHLEAYECMFTLTSKAVFKYKNKKLLEFVIELSDALIKNNGPSALKYRLEKALAQKDLGLDQDSAWTYKEVLKRNPNIAYDTIDRILYEDWNKNWIKGADVIADLTRLVKLEPNNARAYYCLGRALEHYYPNEIAKAVKHYQMAVSLQKNEESAWIGDCHFYLARLLSILFKYEEALASIVKAEEYEQGNAKFRLEKGRILKSLGKYPEAFKEVEAAQRLNAKAAERGADKVNCSMDEIYREKEELLKLKI